MHQIYHLGWIPSWLLETLNGGNSNWKIVYPGHEQQNSHIVIFLQSPSPCSFLWKPAIHLFVQDRNYIRRKTLREGKCCKLGGRSNIGRCILLELFKMPIMFPVCSVLLNSWEWWSVSEGVFYLFPVLHICFPVWAIHSHGCQTAWNWCHLQISTTRRECQGIPAIFWCVSCDALWQK